MLITNGLEKAKDLGHTLVVVLGHKNYYSRFGFKPAVIWNIKAPFEVESDHFMAVELISGALKAVNGIVKYSNAFNSE